MPPPKQHRNNDPEPLMGAVAPDSAPARILGEDEVEEMVAIREGALDVDELAELDDEVT